MKIQLAAVGIIAAFTFAACETTPPTNATKASNSSNMATVVNSNSTGANANSISPITTDPTKANSNRSTINYNGTAKENEASRSSVEEQAKAAGGTIGQGAEDWWLWSKTNAALTTDANLSSSAGINVDVVNSVITFRGTVPSKADVTEADKIGKSITGKKSFANKLVVKAAGSAPTADSNSNMSKAPMKKG